MKATCGPLAFMTREAKNDGLLKIAGVR